MSFYNRKVLGKQRCWEVLETLGSILLVLQNHRPPSIPHSSSLVDDGIIAASAECYLRSECAVDAGSHAMAGIGGDQAVVLKVDCSLVSCPKCPVGLNAIPLLLPGDCSAIISGSALIFDS